MRRRRISWRLTSVIIVRCGYLSLVAPLLRRTTVRHQAAGHRPPQGNEEVIMTKITATVKEACQMSGLGKTKLYELMSQGKLETTTVGRRRLVKVESLRALVAA